MRRMLPLILALIGALPFVQARADGVTPAEARACAASTEQTLIELNNYLADDYYHQGEFVKAAEILDRIIALNPLGTEPYATAAWLLWSAGKTPEAFQFYDRMVAANPDDPEAYFEYGAFYLRLKDDENAVKWLARAVQLGLDAPKNHLYGIALARLGRTSEALAFWQQVLKAHPDDEIAQREIGRLTKPQEAPTPQTPATAPAP